MGFDWNVEAIARLHVLFNEGKSDRQMAAILGVEFRHLGELSRSSIIGKRHRLHLQVDALVVHERQREGAKAFRVGGYRPGAGRKKGVAMTHLKGKRVPRSGRRSSDVVETAAGTMETKLPRSYPQVVHNITAKAQQGVAVRDFSLDIPNFECQPVALLDLEPHHCRWPMDQGGFCGRPKLKDEWFPYCAHHCRLGQKRDARVA